MNRKLILLVGIIGLAGVIWFFLNQAGQDDHGTSGAFKTTLGEPVTYQPRTNLVDWVYATTLEAYREVGHQDPAWNEDAETALELAAQNYSTNLNVSPELILEACNRAVEAGCDDPYLRYLQWVQDQNVNQWPYHTRRDEAFEVARAMSKSDYPPFRKAWAYAIALRALADEGVPAGSSLNDFSLAEKALLNTMPVLAKDPNLPPHGLASVCIYYLDACYGRYGQRKPGLDFLEQTLQAPLPDDNPAMKLVEGYYWHQEAWEAGRTPATPSTEQGLRKRFQDYLIKAKAAYEAAWAMESGFPRAQSYIAQKMIAVEGALGGDFQAWFHRAIRADINNYNAYSTMLMFLTPAWGGNPQLMLAFGHQCLAQGNWRARVPLILVDAHLELAGYHTGNHNRSYYLQPGVWKDIQACYEPRLEQYPDDYFSRSRYALLATYCRQWKVADKQLDLLGDRVRKQHFGTADQVLKTRADIKNNLKQLLGEDAATK